VSGLASTKPVVKSNSQAQAVIARSAATKQSSSCPRSWLVSHCGHEKPHSLHNANKRNGTIYTGVTSNLSRRAWEHREALVFGFTARHGCKLLDGLNSTIPGRHRAGETNQGRLTQEKADADRSKQSFVAGSL
jgi:hypothetical protein